MIACEYGWDLETIGKLTPRQIDGLITAIRKRQHFELASDASLHGMKLKSEWRDEGEQELSAENQSALDEALKAAMQRKIREKNV